MQCCKMLTSGRSCQAQLTRIRCAYADRLVYEGKRRNISRGQGRDIRRDIPCTSMGCMDRQRVSRPALSNLKVSSFSQSDIRRCFVRSTSWISPAVLDSKSIEDMIEMHDLVGSDKWSGNPSSYCDMAVSNNFSSFFMSSSN